MGEFGFGPIPVTNSVDIGSKSRLPHASSISICSSCSHDACPMWLHCKHIDELTSDKKVMVSWPESRLLALGSVDFCGKRQSPSREDSELLQETSSATVTGNKQRLAGIWSNVCAHKAMMGCLRARSRT